MKLQRTFPAPSGYKGQLIATVRVEQIGGNAFPHFAVTGEISTADERKRGDFQTGGCIHEHILRVWPEVKLLVDLHLCDSPSGEPMHAEANGFYWLAGCVTGGLGEQYHGSSGDSSHTSVQCLAFLANHLRLDLPSAELAVLTVAGSSCPKAAFAALVEGLRPRWREEAVAGLEWMRKEGAL